jgi:HPt (histidine-containing phosphotransfer) domain-containing protein
MTPHFEQFQALLHSLANAFLDELPERCQRIEARVLTLEQAPGSTDAFNELFREVHSLKGSGGTHGLKIVTSICHELENHLTEASLAQRSAPAFASRALAFVDLLSRVQGYALDGHEGYAELEAELDALRQDALCNRKAGLIAESSPLMVNLYEKALSPLPLRLTVVDDGLQALELLLHEPFDFVVVGRELKELNGIALMVALRAAQARNHRITAWLVSSNHAGIPDAAGFSAVLLRNQKLSENLLQVVKKRMGQ